MPIKIALAGNPNSGKTTLFNVLTGSNQYVGNWPGVTVEKKEGKIKGFKDAVVIDLPGIYSLSPYSMEEVIARDYLIEERPDAIINIIDSTNIERNLYLTTQLLELGIPVVAALNMTDVVEKRGDIIDSARLSAEFGIPAVAVSALKGTGTEEATRLAVGLAREAKANAPVRIFSDVVEGAAVRMEKLLPPSVPARLRRWYSLKLLEKDVKVAAELRPAKEAEEIIGGIEAFYGDDAESVMINERYTYVERAVRLCVRRVESVTVTEKIDRIMTNRWLALPIFAAVMFFVYFIAVTTLGAAATNFTNDVLIGKWIGEPMSSYLPSAGVPDWLSSLLIDGIIGGVGAVAGFVPQMLILFALLAFLEECGYMSRVAFIMDRLFRKFGLSGKSFIPMLISTGCGVPGIMASRTIENSRDRKMTIITATFMPCGAKMPVVAMIAGVVFGGAWWVAPSAYFIGVAAVVVSGLILKKTRLFAGEASPFIMELPSYHLPALKSMARSTWERGWSFIKKAGTLILLASMLIWFLAGFGFANGSFGPVDRIDMSVLADIGRPISVIFIPLGFGNWEATVATLMGILAKEEIVGVFGVLSEISGGAADTAEFTAFLPTALAAFSFLVFNLLCAPCVAAIGAIKREMNNAGWTLFAVGYQCVFAYSTAFMLYQFGLLASGGGFGLPTGAASAVLLAAAYLLLRQNASQNSRQYIVKQL